MAKRLTANATPELRQVMDEKLHVHTFPTGKFIWFCPRNKCRTQNEIQGGDVDVIRKCEHCGVEVQLIFGGAVAAPPPAPKLQDPEKPKVSRQFSLDE